MDNHNYKFKILKLFVVLEWGSGGQGVGEGCWRKREGVPAGHLGELPDNVWHDFQGAASPAARHAHQDRLEQDCVVQHRPRTKEPVICFSPPTLFFCSQSFAADGHLTSQTAFLPPSKLKFVLPSSPLSLRAIEIKMPLNNANEISIGQIERACTVKFWLCQITYFKSSVVCCATLHCTQIWFARDVQLALLQTKSSALC